MADALPLGLYLPPGVKPFGPGNNCNLDICPIEFTVYGYRPSLAANITFLSLYFISAAIHLYLGTRWKTRFFMICMLAGACNAIIGYAARIALYYNPFNFTAFMIQIICITSGPAYYSAAIYVTLADAVTPSAAPLFLGLHQLRCGLSPLPGAGGALSTVSAASLGSEQLSKAGVDMALTGLSMQVIVMVVFCGLFADYLIRYFRAGRTDRFGRRAQLFFSFMALAILLILARCAYRLFELRDGYESESIRNESYFIALEGGVWLMNPQK
ncbi:phospholipid-translocating ATPase [Apiospora hydei]|uniref:Phospholipid-translocating ATPase n=1 Tax=Apiospora hydei TaxID=1337664 RepID=A0ABR1XBQ4_9PEZI